MCVTLDIVLGGVGCNSHVCRQTDIGMSVAQDTARAQALQPVCRLKSARAREPLSYLFPCPTIHPAPSFHIPFISFLVVALRSALSLTLRALAVERVGLAGVGAKGTGNLYRSHGTDCWHVGEGKSKQYRQSLGGLTGVR